MIRHSNLYGAGGYRFNQTTMKAAECRFAHGLSMDTLRRSKMPVEAIKNFSEEAAINIISSTLHDNAGSINYNPTFNPIDKIVELY